MAACIWCINGRVAGTGVVCRTCNGSGKQRNRGSSTCNRCLVRPREFDSPDDMCEACWHEWWNADLPN